MKRQTILGAIAALALAIVPFFAATPAMADTVNGVTCNSYHSLYPTEGSAWPNDWTASNPNGHYFICSSGITHAQAVQVLQTPQGLLATQRNLMQQQNVNYYFFANRANTASYMQGKAPYAGHSQFASTTARCGNTGYLYSGAPTIAVEIYQTCQFAGTTPPNPSFYDVTLHETGHAFDYSLAAANPNNHIVPPSHTKAFKNLFNKSTNNPIEASDTWYFDNGFQGQSAPLTCDLFGVITPPPLERDLGLPNSSLSPVCTNGVVNAPFAGLHNSQIAQKQDPYFVGNADPYGELFAEQFAQATGIQDPDPLALIDYYIWKYRCTERAVVYFMNTLAPPPNTQLSGLKCPIPAASDWNTN